MKLVLLIKNFLKKKHIYNQDRFSFSFPKSIIYFSFQTILRLPFTKSGIRMETLTELLLLIESFTLPCLQLANNEILIFFLSPSELQKFLFLYFMSKYRYHKKSRWYVEHLKNRTQICYCKMSLRNIEFVQLKRCDRRPDQNINFMYDLIV